MVVMVMVVLVFTMMLMFLPCSSNIDTIHLREVFKKSKWKFKMAFAMKGGGRDRSRVPHTYSEK